jgi:hypothetical protein
MEGLIGNVTLEMKYKLCEVINIQCMHSALEVTDYDHMDHMRQSTRY